ncbi:IclR family transcriptional regulator [Arthrobacter zhaoguopingii]|uniref:IclR family transcriptional regulator n=1 Tax=Arthrobacter zhaoguopingii TaxID=2681491 RepID=UPI001356E9DF|nr:IclR family transcriptional regulator [Arthrobacter zhaoguopingii]
MNNTTTRPKQQTLQTVERALTFLELVASAPEPPTVQTVAAALELNITTCYHLLRTLVARGYVERHDDLTLTLGSQVGLLFRAYQDTFDVNESLASIVNRLAEQTSETAYLSVRDGRSVILKVLVEGSQPLRVSGLYVGQSGNEHIRSSGKAVLAHLDPPAQAEMLAQALQNLSASEREAVSRRLVAELDNTRKRGWSLDGQESDLGISSVGAPVFDARGNVFGAVGVVTPTTRMDRFQPFFVDAVRSAAAEATELLSRKVST